MFNKNIGYKNTIRILRLSAVFKEFMLIFPVMMLIYQEKGVSTGDFFLIQGIFFFFMFFLEIPTGYIGDIFSRKKVLLVSSFFMPVAYVALYFNTGFWNLLLVDVLWAISASLGSGTTQAYLYDTLKAEGKEINAIKEYGKLSSYQIIGTAIATFIGGLLYSIYGMDNLILAEIVFMVISFVLLLFIPELKSSKRVVDINTSKLRDIFNIVKYAINHQKIKWLIAFTSLFSVAGMILIWGMQPLMEYSLISVGLFGFFVGMSQVFRAVFAQFSDKLLKKLKIKKLYYILYIVLALGFIASLLVFNISSIYIIYILLIIIGFASGVESCVYIITTSMINQEIKSEERATVLSVGSMFASLLLGIAMISCKFIIDGASLQAMYFILGPITLLLLLYGMKKLLRLYKS